MTVLGDIGDLAGEIKQQASRLTNPDYPVETVMAIPDAPTPPSGGTVSHGYVS